MTSNPHYHELEEYQNRVRKLGEIRQLGVEPYPHRFEPTARAGALEAAHDGAPVGDSAAAEAGTTEHACVAGRLVLFRAMGKNAFGHIQDGSGRIQVMINRDHTAVEGYTPGEGDPKPTKFIEKKLDLGDLIGVEGHLFRTMKGELTIYATKVTLLCKTLLPLADKHAGLADKETRYRKRWLDLIANDDVRERFKSRSRIIRTIREFLEQQDFVEVETPVLQTIYGGAEARPFRTRLNALDQEMFLRISLEISLKKLMVGGMERIFEIGRVFRNEGIDRTHNPEFTMLEVYAAYWDYNDMMKLVEELYETIALKLFGTTKVPVTIDNDGTVVEIDVKAPWTRMTMKESIKRYGEIDVDALDDDAIKELLLSKGGDKLTLSNRPRGLLIADLFETFVEEKLVQPHHITDHPVETTPLCKQHRDPASRDEGLVERFESFVVCNEACNAYSELNDPEVQRKLLVQQSEQLDAGNEEANPLDEEFIEAICQGMPPAGGVGIGIDRLVMLFTNAYSIRDVLYFPWMKPQE